jgi:hypothetical protein
MRTFSTLAFATAIIFSTFSLTHAGHIEVRFDEGAPKDRFSIINMSVCDHGPMNIKIDMAPSPYGLIFDVTASGAGVEVFQPLEFVRGEESLAKVPSVRDGDNALTLDLLNLSARQSVAFTIDVDDTVDKRQITVADEEISKAIVELSQGDFTSQVNFGQNAVAVVDMPDC